MTDEKPDPTEETKEPKATKKPEEETSEDKPARKRAPVPPGQPVMRPSSQDVLASVQLLREAEANVKRVLEIGAIKVAGNLFGSIRKARARAEEAMPLNKGGNLHG